MEMDGFIAWQSPGGRVVHLAENDNEYGEDVVLWKEHRAPADEFAVNPLDLLIEAEETAEDEDTTVDQDTDEIVDNWSRGMTYEEFFEDAVGSADGFSVTPGKETPWDDDEYLKPIMPTEGDMELTQVGSRRAVAMNNGSLRERTPRAVIASGRRRNDRNRMEPIREARRDQKHNQN